MTLEDNLRSMERSRENYWLRYPNTSPLKLRWRANTVRHSFHVLPGETILELGAGTGLWTEHLCSVLRGENHITAVVFNDELIARARDLPNVTFQKVDNLLKDLPAESFDYIVGTAILCHDKYPQNLAAVYKLLKPGGQFLFFEANYWNPQVLIKNYIRPLGQMFGDPPCLVGMRQYKLMKIASNQGFTNLEIIPYDIIHAMTPRALVRPLQSIAYFLEHTPLVRDLCGSLYLWGKKPGNERASRPYVSLANHKELFGAVSVVVPCYNEEMNISILVSTMIRCYGDYIQEIIVVNDNSTDNTAAVVTDLAEQDPRVKIVNRKPPGGVGRALRDGYAAASGRYILTMDCDFALIVPELRDLFDAIAEGHDGAIGSRFSYESTLLNYPFFKIFCNRCFHLIANLFLRLRIRDISNNLKLYRGEILKSLEIEQDNFAANAETGLKPLLAGYDIKEVPISWINRTIDMGTSSFGIAKVAPSYFFELVKIVWKEWRKPMTVRKASSKINDSEKL